MLQVPMLDEDHHGLELWRVLEQRPSVLDKLGDRSLRSEAVRTRIVLGCSMVVLGCSRIVLGCSRVVLGCSRVVLGCSRIVLGCCRVVLGCSRIVLGCSVL